MSSSNKTLIIVAVIGLIGALGSALINNFGVSSEKSTTIIIGDQQLAGVTGIKKRNNDPLIQLTKEEIDQLRALLTPTKTQKKYSISLQSPNQVASFAIGVKRTTTNKFSGWGKVIEISPDDSLYLNMHYFANGGDAKNVKVVMNYLHNKVINKESTNQIHSKIWAENAGQIFDSVQLNSKQEVLLKLVGYSWQQNECQSTECQSILPNNQSGFNAMRSDGISIGNVPKNNYGNIVLKFSVNKI